MITIDSQSLIESSLIKYGFNTLEPSKLPMDERYKPMANELIADNSTINFYQKCIGTLSYIAMHCRPDISLATNVMSRFASNPSPDHMKAVIRIYRYLLGTLDYKLTLKRGDEPSLNIVGYSDSDWGGDLNDRKSTSGYILTLSNIPIYWKSAKQKCTAQSATEAEYISASDLIKRTMEVKNLLDEIGIKYTTPILYCDNNAANTILNKGINQSKLKHIAIRYQLLKDQLNKKELDVKRIDTKENYADVLTKPLGISNFLKFCNSIMNSNFILHTQSKSSSINIDQSIV
jgi:hypothetical protein